MRARVECCNGDVVLQRNHRVGLAVVRELVRNHVPLVLLGNISGCAVEKSVAGQVKCRMGRCVRAWACESGVGAVMRVQRSPHLRVCMCVRAHTHTMHAHTLPSAHVIRRAHAHRRTDTIVYARTHTHANDRATQTFLMT